MPLLLVEYPTGRPSSKVDTWGIVRPNFEAFSVSVPEKASKFGDRGWSGTCVSLLYSHPPVRILMLSHQFPPETAFGGIASYTATMSRKLSERGHEVHVLTCWDGKER